ncbi:MAG: hypothetical protein SV253_06380 [Halobacteria archaeon]|nr:hypothetical protein [Halobacteria archaeon]
MSVSLGYRKQPLLVSWIAVFGSYFGFNADWAFFGLSSRSLAEKTAFLLDPESLFVFSVAAVVFGTLGFGVGYVAALVVEYLR